MTNNAEGFRDQKTTRPKKANVSSSDRREISETGVLREVLLTEVRRGKADSESVCSAQPGEEYNGKVTEKNYSSDK